MRLLSAWELLEVWERAVALPPSARALELLETCFDDEQGPPPAEWALGTRNRRLMAVRQSLLGPEATGIADCPGCDAKLEVSFDFDELIAHADGSASDPAPVAWEDGLLQCRSPTTADVLAVSTLEGRAAQRLALLSRCVSMGEPGRPEDHGSPLDADVAAALPAAVVEELAAVLSAADPLADVQLSMTCADCGQSWQTAFDAVTFVWSELSAWVERTLGEVHVLACAYGWSEAEVLAVGRRRREYYLQAVGG